MCIRDRLDRGRHVAECRVGLISQSLPRTIELVEKLANHVGPDRRARHPDSGLSETAQRPRRHLAPVDRVEQRVELAGRFASHHELARLERCKNVVAAARHRPRDSAEHKTAICLARPKARVLVDVALEPVSYTHLDVYKRQLLYH